MKNINLNNVFRKISEDIYECLSKAGYATAEKHVKILNRAIKQISVEHKRNVIPDNIIASITTNPRSVIGKINAPKRKNYEHRILFGAEPSEIGSWAEEKEGLRKWIRKNKRKYNAFAEVKSKRDIDRFAFFIWRKQKKEGIKPFNYYYLAILTYGGFDEFQDAVTTTYKSSLSVRLKNIAKKDYVI